MENKVLVVDDSEMVRNYHSYILKIFKFQVSTAENGLVGLEKALVNNYSLIITDINMPKMDGFEFINKLRENEINIPIIIVSTEDEKRINRINANGIARIHMVKPTDPEKLVKTVREVLSNKP